jgi:hypothetical protein
MNAVEWTSASTSTVCDDSAAKIKGCFPARYAVHSSTAKLPVVLLIALTPTQVCSGTGI